MQPFLDAIKAKIKSALARFAKQKAQNQAEGMASEATGIVDSARNFAREEPMRAGVLALLTVGLLWLMFRRDESE
jgi:ElaB/YqjD/DUF883 family membrane-anchored ribosome-binding protein